MGNEGCKLTFDELVARMKKEPQRRKRPYEEEHRIQCACVQWFYFKHPELRGRLFAVPNGGERNVVVAAKLKAEGVVQGVSDLILLRRNRNYGALLIEMKGAKGKQTELQKKWESTVCSDDEYKYVVCHSLDDFIREVEDFLNNV